MVIAGRLPRAPLIFVLGQVRFSAVKKMKEYVPDIQETLRRNGYPLCEESIGQRLVLGPKPAVEPEERWIFSDKEKQTAIVLSTGFVVLETCRYTVFEDLVERFKYVVDVVGNTADIAVSERVGLRYVDLIREIDGKPAHDLVVPELRGIKLPGYSQETLRHYIMQSVTDKGILRINAVHTSDGTIMPPDLDSTKLDMYIDPPVKKGQSVIILDSDHFCEKREDYSAETLSILLTDLHDSGISPAFKSAMTEDALALYKKEA